MNLQAHLVLTRRKTNSFFMIPVGDPRNENHQCRFSGNKVGKSDQIVSLIQNPI